MIKLSMHKAEGARQEPSPTPRENWTTTKWNDQASIPIISSINARHLTKYNT
jgi:hypothetical protein